MPDSTQEVGIMDYDPLDVESVVLHGFEEEEDLDGADSGFMQGYLGMGEA